MSLNLVFNKTGKEIKGAIQNRIDALNSRLNKRNIELDKLLNDTPRLRSYILRNTQTNYGHGGRYSNASTLYSKNHISSEEVEEINQLCTRVMEIEQEIGKLELTLKHLVDDQEFELDFDDLVKYGFE